MKRFITILIAVFVALNMLAAYNQQGIAYFFDYKTKKKTPLAGVSIAANGAQPAVSSANGTFTLKFSTLGLGQKISFSKQPFYQGMKVFNKQVVDNWYIVQGRLVLIMCKYEEFELAKNNYYAQGKASVEKKYKSRIEVLAKEVQQLRKENKDCAQQMQELQELNEEYERIMDDLRNSADAMARIDQSELDEEMREVLDLYERGEVDEAMQKLDALNLKEKFEKTLSVKQYYEQEAVAAAQDSALVLAQIRSSIDLYKNNGDYDKVGEYLKLLADRLNTFDDIFEYAYFCNEQNLFYEAETYYTKALVQIQGLASLNPQAHEPSLAKALDNIGSLYSNTQRYTESEEAYKEALGIRRRLSASNPDAYESDLAKTLNNMGNLYSDTHRFSESEALFKETLEIYRRLASSNPQTYEPYLAATLNNISSLYHDVLCFEESEEALLSALDIYKHLAAENPQAYESDLAVIQINLGVMYSETQRFEESEKVFIQALEIYKRLTEKNPKAYELYLAKTLGYLGTLYSETQRFRESEEAYLQAVGILSQIYGEKLHKSIFSSNDFDEIFARTAELQVYEPELAKTLYNLGCLYIRMECFEESKETYALALEIYEELAVNNSGVYDPHIAKTLNNLCVLYIITENYKEAFNYATQARDIYQRLEKEHPSIYQGKTDNIDELLHLILKKKAQP